MSAKEALENYYRKQMSPGVRSPKRRNKKPEEEVVKDILRWSARQGWSIHRVESKAVYSAGAGRYLRGQTIAGLSDLVGNDSEGRGVYVEAKAPGKCSTLRPGQAVFLKEKIRTNCFAVCCDSVQLLEEYYKAWCSLGMVDRHKYLMNLLPKKFEDL